MKEPKSKITNYTTQNGLPLKVINAITQDKDGFMWFAAEDGVARFDGYTFRIFRNDPENPFSLSHNYIYWIFTDAEGVVWTSSRKGINRFDSNTEHFIHYQHNSKNNNSLVGDDVSHISQSANGNLWVSCWGSGITYVDKKKERFIQYSKRNLPGLSSQKVMCTYEDRDGMLWVGSLEGGLDVFKTKNGIITQKVEGFSNNAIASLQDVRCIVPDHYGNLWIGTKQGLVFFNKKQRMFQIPETHSDILKSNTIWSLLVDSQQNLWIGVLDKGLYKASLKDLSKTSSADIFAEPVKGEGEYSINSHTIHSIYEDRDKNIWLATNGDGAQMINSVKEKFMRIEVKQSDESNRKYLRFWGMCHDEKNNLWLGSDGNGIYKYDSQGNLLKNYYADGKKGSLTDNAILCAFRDHTNTLWFGTYSQGLFRYNEKTDTFTNYKHDPANPQSLGKNDVRVIFEDSRHNLWIGTNWGGLNLLNKKTGMFTSYTVLNSDISSSDIRAIIEDKRGGLWLGCSQGGVSYFDPEKKSFQKYFNNPNSKTDLSGNMVYALYIGRDERLWIGTEGAGLHIYDPVKKQLQQVSSKSGLDCSTVFAIQEDKNSNVWMSTNRGISKWDKKENKFYNYDGSDGLQNGQFNSCSFMYNKSLDLMSFAGTEGVTVFYPEQVKQNLRLSDVMIIGFQLFNKPVEINPSDKDAIIKQAINQTPEISLHYNQSVFTFEYAALNYTLPGKSKYAYMMEEFDKDWNYVNTSRTATYTNLDPGEYVFKVKASNNDGIWNEKPASIIIHIIPPWWQTWWFRLFAILTLMGSGIGYYKIRVQSIKQQNKKLEKSVLEKTAQLQQANDELLLREEEIKAQNEDLSLQNDQLIQRQEEIASQRDLLTDQNKKLETAWKTIEEHNRTLDQEVQERTKELVEYNQQLEQFAFIAAHNLRAPVARILGLGQVLDLPRTNPDEEKMIVNKLVRTTEELDNVVRDLNTILEIRKNNTHVLGRIDLTEELNIIKANLQHEIAETQTKISADFSAVNVIYTAKPYLDSILINLIHNAIKYRDTNRRPTIQLKTELHEEHICLSINDNGLGIDLELHQRNIFNLYKRFHSHVEGKGIGLYLVKTQVAALGGKIEVESKVNVGTTFKVYLRKGDARPFNGDAL
ncbi:MAG TPA: two-component regulator propeller domain-containing protein [Cyclobacteriaceae bacterium]